MYEINTTLNMPFETAVEHVKSVLMEHQLGIVSEVNVQAVFKTKMDKDIPAYRIFGACNPKLAERVIDSEPNAGVLLPCNFIMRETASEETVVSFMDPVSVFGLCETDEPKQVAKEAKEKLLKVIEKLNG